MDLMHSQKINLMYVHVQVLSNIKSELWMS